MAKGRVPAAQESVPEEVENGSESEPELPDEHQLTKKPSTLSKKSIIPKPMSHATSYDEDKSGCSSGAGVKRPAAVGDGQGKELKRSKKESKIYAEELEKEGTTNDESRKSFQRLWSEDDEIAVLNGLTDFSANKEVFPSISLDYFYDIIKESVHFNVSKVQLKDKIRKLRRKYNSNYNYNEDKARKGEVWILPKEHEQKCFELSKKVWGKDSYTDEGKLLEGLKFDGDVGRRSRSKNSKTPVNEVKDEEVKNSGGGDTGLEGMKFVNLGLGKIGVEEWIMENIQFVDTEMRAKMNEKRKEFEIVQAGFYVKKLELMLDQTNLVLNALKSSD